MRHIAVTFLLLLLTFRMSAKELPDTSQINITLQRQLGAAFVPINEWGVHSITGQTQWLKYDFSPQAFTTYQAAYSMQRIPLVVGLNAQFEDNLVGKAYRIAGFVGIKRIMLRVESGKIRGTARWTGTPIQGASTSIPFDNRYTNIDLLYLPNTPSLKGNLFYYGVGFTSFKMPVQINTLTTESGKGSQKFGVPVYDSLFSVTAYSLVFGFDLIATEASNPKAFKGGFGMFATTQDKFGGGMSKMSSEALKRAEDANPLRTAASSNLPAALVEYNLSVGFKYSQRIGSGIIIAALGYDFGGAMLADFSGGVSTKNNLGFDPSFYYVHHGVLLRIYAGW